MTGRQVRRSKLLGKIAGAPILGAALSCAPPAHLRPPSAPEQGHTDEVGIAVVGVSSRPFVDEKASRSTQMWYTRELDRRWILSFISAYGDGALLAGSALRFEAVSSNTFSTGAEVEAGFLWGAVSVPIDLHLHDRIHLYAAPKLGNWGAELTPFVPVGLNTRLSGGLYLRVELQMSWADFDYYNRRTHAAAALTYDW